MITTLRRLLQRGRFYSLLNRLPRTDADKLRSLGFSSELTTHLSEHAGVGETRRVMARLTGEVRPPRAGEWYLSEAHQGVMLTGYNHTDEASIAELVVVREKVRVEHTIEKVL